MGRLLFRIGATVILVAVMAAFVFLAVGPRIADKSMNPVTPHEPYAVSEEARALHATIPVADLHADSLLWNRDLLKRNDRGHVDLPRLREGGVFLQVFTAVTKSPEGQNYEENATDAKDNITRLAMAQRWPRRTWDSRTERAVYQAEKLAGFVAEDSGLVVVRNWEDLSALGDFERDRRQMTMTFQEFEKLTLEEREALTQESELRTSEELQELEANWPTARGGLSVRSSGYLHREPVVQDRPHIAAILGTEGSHTLDGKLENIDRLYDAGYRVMGLQHFFDNRLGGSLHGQSGAGLTEFGREAVLRMAEKEIIIDVAHSSEQLVRDTLALIDRPVILSHTGFNGHCQTPRNISDETMAMIAEGGGLIGVGFWEDVTCDASPAGIADAILYGVERFGVDHIALGSDFDGTVETALDASELPAITQALMDRGLPEEDIRKVMGGNTVRFFLENLPGD